MSGKPRLTDEERAHRRTVALERNREYHRENRAAITERHRRAMLKWRYGITYQQWDALFEVQGRCCAICRKSAPDRRGWATDHDHQTGRVRGILCQRCNLVLGWLGDHAEAVRAMHATILAYLDRPGIEPSERSPGRGAPRRVSGARPHAKT